MAQLMCQIDHSFWAGTNSTCDAYHGNMPVMAIARSKLTAQGQISVPAWVRRKLGVGPGSVLEWVEEGEKVVVRRAGRYSSEDVHRSLFASPPGRRTLAELKAAVRRRIRKRHASRLTPAC